MLTEPRNTSLHFSLMLCMLYAESKLCSGEDNSIAGTQRIG
jgi:hypothetical protein